MGLLSAVSRLGRFFTGSASPDVSNESLKRVRVCRFEKMETRKVLASDLYIGAVYFEDATGDDSDGDTIEITFKGGAPGTQLTRLIIDGDKLGDGLSIGDVFFDTEAGGLGVYGHYPFTLISSEGFTITNVFVEDGGTQLIIDFEGFDAGEKLVFKIDVDEVAFFTATSVAEGAEFEGSKLIATFENPNYETVTGTAIFYDFYDNNFAEYAQQSGHVLDLPPDAYMPPHTVDRSDRTAGAGMVLEQTPKPITISGTVYSDPNLNNQLDPGEVGIGNVTLTLMRWDGSKYVATGMSTKTDSNGNYKFEGVQPGKYQIVETQPQGFFSVGSTIGTVDGSSRGSVVSVDILGEIELFGGEDSINNDFAEAPPASIAGNVYHDRNNDGIRDANEEGIGGVTIVIEPINTIVPSQSIQVITNPDGSYEAYGLVPGTYRVYQLKQPEGYLDGLDTPGSVGGVAINPGDEIGGIILVGGTQAVEYNFGELLPSLISGRVHADENGNCTFDPGEKPIAGVTIQLLDASGKVIATTKTDVNGFYEFKGLAPGTYGIHEVQPEGYFDGGEKVGTAGGIRSANDTITSIVLVSNTQGLNYDFCENVPVSISGYVYVDDNNNGVYDSSESPIANVELELLDANGNPTGIKTRTDANGFYKFDGLAQGTYGVRQFQPEGYIDGLDSAGSAGGQALNPGDQITGAILVWGKHAVNYNFGELRPASISGRVHADTNGNCEYDPGELLLSGVKIELLDAQGNVIRTTYTDINGEYKFDDLPPGTYSIRQIQPEGYFEGADRVGSEGGVNSGNNLITGIELGSGVVGVRYDFCEKPPSSISGRVHADLNGNCEYDPGEPLLSGVKIELLDHQGKVLRTTYTDANGEYKFDDLPPGTYGIREIQPEGYFDGGDSVGTAGGVNSANDLITGIILIGGTFGEDYNFCEKPPSSISGRVHADTNGNCEYDPGEKTIAGVKIELLDAKGKVIATTYTDSNGLYKFDNLAPGTYGIREIQPEGYFDGGDKVGSAGGVNSANDLITEIVLIGGTIGIDYNFCEIPPASISGYVFVDVNGDCIKDANEQGISGVLMELLDANGQRTGIQTTTDANGFYQFEGLAPGTYGVIQVNQPSGYLDGDDCPGDSGGEAQNPGDRITGAVLKPGHDATNYNFKEHLPGKLSGYVFKDGATILYPEGEQPDFSGKDGRRTPDDTPIAGVILQLGDEFGNPILDAKGNPVQAVTNHLGYYEFSGLAPGYYSVRQIQPNGYIDSIDTPGPRGGIAINLGANLGDLENKLHESLRGTYDAIIRIPVVYGQNSVENNFSEVQILEVPPPQYYPPEDPRTPPPPPPVFVLPPPPLAVPFIPTPVYNNPINNLYIGSSPAIGYTWHLSVIDAGFPREVADEGKQLSQLISLSSEKFDWSEINMQLGQWQVNMDDGEFARFIFGMPGAKPIVGDFNGDGIAEKGVYYKGFWFIDINGNGVWDEGDLWAKLGTEHDQPVVGDWDGDGKDDIGIFGRAWAGDPRAIEHEPGIPTPFNTTSTGRTKNLPPEVEEATNGKRVMQLTEKGNVREDLIDHVFHYGDGQDIAVVGDWTGDGVDTIAIFRDGRWRLDVNGDGKWGPEDLEVQFGQAGDLPVVGDWTGDGIDKLGIFRNGTFYLDTNNNHQIDASDRVFEMGNAGDLPFAADFNGDGIDEVGVYSNNGHFGSTASSF